MPDVGKPATQVGVPTAAPVFALPELSARLVPLPSFRFQTPSSPAWGVVISVSLAALDLRHGAGRVPDPYLVDDAGEEAGGCTGRREGAADRGERVGEGIGRFADRERPDRGTVEVEVPGGAVVGRGGVVPGAISRDRIVRADDRMIQAAGRHRVCDTAGSILFEVSDELAVRVDPEEVVDVRVRRLGLRPAFRDQRDRTVIPPFPVLVATPAPVRLNHNSTVKVALRRSDAAPSVAY